VIDAVATPAGTSIRVTPRISIVALVLGVLSVALLAAAFVWAHHWGAVADTLIVAWALATVGALVLSIRFYFLEDVWPTHISRQLAGIGLAGGLISVATLILSGFLWAVGINPTGVCGGG
jgi:drug/metabolite transporter (DMT)-like permease